MLLSATLAAVALLLVLASTAGAHAKVTISGTAYMNEAGTPWTTANGGGCDGSTANIGISFNGGPAVSGTCDATTGAFSIPVHTPDSDKPLVVYMNTGGGDRGVTYTTNTTSSAGVSGIALTRNLVRIRRDSSAAPTWRGALLNTFDQGKDADVPLVSSGATLTTPSSVGVLLEAGADLTAPATVSVGSMQVDGVVTAAIPSLTLTGSGTSTNCAADHGTQVPLCVTGTLPKPATTTFAGTGATQVPMLPWNNLKLAPAGPGNPTYILGTAPGQVIAPDAQLTIGNGTDPVTVSTSAHSPDINPGSSIIMSTNGVLGGTGTGTVWVNAGFGGGGTVNLPFADVVHRQTAWAGFGPTAGTTWTFDDMTVVAATVAHDVVMSGPGGLAINGNLTIGLNTDAVKAYLDDHGVPIHVTGDVIIGSKAEYLTNGDLSISGNLVIDGLFTNWPNSNVAFDGVGTSSVTTAANEGMTTVTVSTPGKTVAFDHRRTTTITTLNAVGASCASGAVNLRSTLPGTQATLALTNANVNFASLQDSKLTAAKSAFGSTNAGNLTGWTTIPCGTVAMSGTAYMDEAGTPWTTANGGGCDGVTQNVSVVFDGGPKASTSCNATTGAWSINVGATAPDRPFVVFLDTGGGQYGATASRNLDTSTPIGGIAITKGLLRIRSETATPVQSADLDRIDQAYDADIPFAVASSSALTMAAGGAIYLEAGATFSGFGDVTASSIQVAGTWNKPGLLVLTAGGTSPSCASPSGTQVPLCMMGGGTFSNTSTTRYTASVPFDVAALAYAVLEIKPATGGNPLVRLGTGAGQTLQTSGLVLGDGINPVTVSTSAFAPGVTGASMTVAANALLTGNGSGLLMFRGTVNGSGTIDLSGGEFDMRGAFNSLWVQAAGRTWTFNDLTFSADSLGDATIFASSGTGTTVVNGTFRVGRNDDIGMTQALLDGTRDFDINGDIEIGPKGTLSVPSTKSFLLAGDLVNHGTFTSNGGTLTLDGYDEATLDYDAPTTFGTLAILSPNKEVRFDHVHATTAANFIVSGGSCASGLVSIRSTLNGTRFTLNATSSDIRYATIRDAAAGSATAAGGSVDGGNNNGSWSISPCVTVSGTAYSDEAGTPWRLMTGGDCDGFTQNIGIAVAGRATGSTTCDPFSGNWTTQVAIPAVDAPVTAWLESSAGRGAVVTRASSTSANITGLSITEDVMRIRSESATPVDNATIDRYDQTKAPSYPVAVTGTTLTAPAYPALGILVESGDTYRPGGSVTVPALSLEGTFDGTASPVLTLTSVGTDATCSQPTGVQVPLCISGAGDVSVPSPITTFTGTGAYRVPGEGYADLRLQPTAGPATIDLGTAAAQSFTATFLRIGTVGQATTASTSAYAPNVTLANDLIVAANGTIGGSGAGTMQVGGAVSGAGRLDFTGGLFEMRMLASGAFGQTAGALTWNFKDLRFSNPDAALARTATFAAGGTAGTIAVSGNLMVGRAGDTATTTVNDNTNDHVIDVDGSVIVGNTGILQASNTAAFTVGGDFTNNGTFTSNAGTLTIDGTGTSSLSYAANTSFGTLRATIPSKTVQFDHLHQTTIATFVASGNSCATGPLNLRSTLAGAQAPLVVTASNVQHATIQDVAVSTAHTAVGSTNLGNNGANWTYTGCVAVSGAALANEAGLPWIPANGGACDGLTPNVAISSNGNVPSTTTCDPATGAWSTSIGIRTADTPLVAFLDTGGGDKGATITRNVDTTSAIPGIAITRNHLRVRSETATSVTNTQVNAYDQDQDADIPAQVTGANLTMAGGTGILVEAGDTYAPGGNVTTPSLQLDGTFTGGATTLTLNGSGTNASCATAPGTQVPLCLNGGTFTAPTTTRFAGTAATRIPSDATYAALQLSPIAAGGPTFELGTAAAQTVTATALTVGDGVNPVTVSTSSYSPNVTVNGALSVSAGATLGGTGNGTIAVSGSATGSGTITLADGVFDMRGTAAANFGQSVGALTWTFDDLVFSNSGGIARAVSTAAGGLAGTIVVDGTLSVGRVGDAATTTFNNNTNDHPVDVNGNVSTLATGLLLASNSQSFKIGDDLTNAGTFTANAGTVTFDGSATSTLTYAAATTFGTISVQTPDKVVEFDHLRQTNVATLNVTGTSCASGRVSLVSDLPGSQYTIAITSSTIRNATIRDANVTTPTPAGAVDGGNNTGWAFSCGGSVTVSGTAYANEAGAPWTAANGGDCDGFTPNVSLSVDGGVAQSTSCNPVNGNWSLSVPMDLPSRALTVYLDTNGGHRGAIVTRMAATVGNLTGLSLTENLLRIRSEDASTITNALLDTYDATQDADHPAAVVGPNLTLAAGVGLVVETGTTFVAGGNVLASSVQADGAFTALAVTLTGSGTNANCATDNGVQVPVCIAGGSFTATGTTFTGTRDYNVTGLATYGSLALSPTGSSPQVQLGSGPGQTIGVTSLAIGQFGGAPMTASTSAYSPTVDVSGTLTVNAALNGSGTGTITVLGNIAGSGSIDFTAGLVELRRDWAGTFGSPGAWAFNDLTLSSGTVSGNVLTAVSGPGVIHVRGSMNIGRVTDAFTTVLDVNTNDRMLDVDGNLVITSRGSLQASSTLPLTVAGDFTNNGTFTHNSGTVTFDGAGTSTLAYAANTSFFGLASSTPGKTLRFEHLFQTTVNTLSVEGQGCGVGEVNLRSRLDGTQFTLNATVANVQYATVRDSLISTPVSARGSSSAGNNGPNWTFNGCVTVSGTVYADEAGAPWTLVNGGMCDGSTPVVAVLVNGLARRATTCDAITGAWSLSVGASAANGTVLAFLDTGGGARGSVITHNADATSAIGGLDITSGNVRLRSESGAAITNAQLDAYDKTQDADIPFSVFGGAMGISGGEGLIVAAGGVYTPGGDVTVPALQLHGAFNQAGGSLYLTASGTNSNCNAAVGDQIPLCIAGGSFVAGGATYYEGTAATKVTATTYGALVVSPASGLAAYELGTAGGQTITAGNTTFTNVIASTTANSPNLTLASLWVGGKLVGSGSGSILVNGAVAGPGEVNLTGGSFEQRPSATGGFKSSGNSTPWTFNDLTFSSSAAGPITINGGGGVPAVIGAIVTNGALTIGRASDLANTTLELDVVDVPVDANGNVVISSRGVLKASSASPIAIAGNFTNSGTFTHDAGTVSFDGAGTSVLTYAAATTFGTLASTTPTKTLRFDHLRTTNVGTLAIQGTSCSAGQVNLRSDLDGSQFTIAVTTSAVAYATIRDSNVTTAKVAQGSTNVGNNSANWSFPGCATVSGTATTDEVGTPWIVANGGSCDGATPNVAVSINAAPPLFTTCDATTGAWSLQVALPTADATLMAWLDTNGGTRAAVITRNLNTTNAIAGLTLALNHLWIRSETATSITSADIGAYDVLDVDLPIVYAPGSLIVLDGAEIVVGAGATYAPASTIAAGALRVDGTFVGSGGVTLSAGGTSSTCTNGPGVQSPLCINGGTWNAPSAMYFRGGAIAIPGLAYQVVDFWAGSGSQTVQLGNGVGQTLTATKLDLQAGGSSSIATSTWSPNVTVTGDVTVNSSLVGSGTGTFTVNGNLTGTGTVNLTGGAFELRSTGAARTLGGSYKWAFNDLVLSNATAAPTTVSGIGAMGVDVRGSLTVGKAADTSTTALNQNTVPFQLDIDDDLTITTKGSFTAAAGRMLAIGDDFTNDGTFNANGGTIVFDSASSAALTYAAPTTFATLEVSTPGKTIAFDHVDQTTIGSLVAVGTSCSTGQVAIQSTSAGVRFPLAVTNADIRHVTLRDAGAAAALLASGSVDLGNNDPNWTIGECIQVSGVATTDQAGTPWTIANGGGCDGTTPNISVSWDGEGKRTTTCDATTGAWTVEVGVGPADTPLVAYLDTGGGDRAATYTRTANTSSDISGFTITRDRVRIRSESASAVTHREVARYDGAMDPDLPATAPAGALVIPPNVELLVEAGDTYRPTGDVRAGALEVDGTFIGGSYTVTLEGSGTSASCTAAPSTQMPLCVAGGGTFGASTSTVFAGTSASNVLGATYQALTVAPSGGGAPTVQLGSAASQAIAAASLTVGNGTNPVTVSNSSFAPTVAVSGPVTVAANGTLSGSGAGAFTTTGAVTGSGTINLPSAPFEQRIAGESRFGQTGGATTWTLGDLTLSNSTGSPHATVASSGGTGPIVVAGTLAVGKAGDAAATTLDAARYDRAIDANGTVSVATTGALVAPPTAAFTIAGDFTNAGTFTHSGGLVTIDGAGTSNLTYAAATTFHNLRVATASKVVRFDHLDQTNVVGTTGTYPGLTVDGGACGTPVSLRSTLAADQFALNVTGSSNVAYATVLDSNAVAALTATNSTNGGNNTGWTIGGCAASITVAVTAGAAPSMVAQPGVDGTSQSTVHVVTAAPTGYALVATDLSDTAGLARAGGGTIDDWTGTEAAPSVWAAGANGTNGYFGISVLSATGGRLAKWGAGSGTEADFVTNRYMGLRTVDRQLHATAGPAVDDVVVAYRLNPDEASLAGSYTTTVSYTAVVNP